MQNPQKINSSNHSLNFEPHRYGTIGEEVQGQLIGDVGQLASS